MVTFLFIGKCKDTVMNLAQIIVKLIKISDHSGIGGGGGYEKVDELGKDGSSNRF